MKVYYTDREKNLPQVSLAHIEQNARYVLETKGIKMLCVNATSRKADRLYTVAEGNEICQQLIDDTLYHEGLWC